MYVLNDLWSIKLGYYESKSRSNCDLDQTCRVEFVCEGRAIAQPSGSVRRSDDGSDENARSVGCSPEKGMVVPARAALQPSETPRTRVRVELGLNTIIISTRP